MKLHVFNPENDLALACYAPFFIPPHSARLMARECAALPAWWAEIGDVVRVADCETTQKWAERLGVLCPPVQWVSRADELPVEGVMPWGWSPLLVQQMKNEGISSALLLSKNQLDDCRDFSHRKHAVQLLTALMDKEKPFATKWGEWLCGTSCYVSDEAVLSRLITKRERSLLKAPWSGSGKGLRIADGVYASPLTGWCRRVIREQGGVVVEPIYNKVYDLAMEFYAEPDGSVRYKGMSLLLTTGRGTYVGNKVMSEEKKRQWWATHLPLMLLDDVRQELQVQLAAMLKGRYIGPLGVDMMLCNESQESHLCLHPCVEINLRRTMGHVSVDLFRWVAFDAEALFQVEYFKASTDLWKDHQERLKNQPLSLEEGRYRSGYLPLAPITPESHYRVMLTGASVIS